MLVEVTGWPKPHEAPRATVAITGAMAICVDRVWIDGENRGDRLTSMDTHAFVVFMVMMTSIVSSDHLDRCVSTQPLKRSCQSQDLG